MATSLLIVHGYSDGSTSFTALGDFFVSQGLYAHDQVFYLDYSSMDDEAAWLVAHAGGRGSTKVRGRLEKLALAVVKAEPLKGKGVMEFVQREFRGHAKTADDDTMALLIDAIGNDPRGLASAVSQLSSDIESKHVGREQAALYYSGHVEVKGYQIADAVANRDRTAALESLRFALVEGGTRAGLMTITAVAGNLRRLALAKSAVGGNRLQGRHFWAGSSERID